jgi:hypothetical protein
MSSLYTPLLVAHVVVAVLGLGSVTSLALVAGAAKEAGASLTILLRYSAYALGIMFITGVLLDLISGGAFHQAWWFRGSALLLFVTGALHAQARRSLRSARAEKEAGVMLRRVQRIAYGMCVLLGGITVLMEVKPFR